MATTHVVAGLAADPDLAAIARVAALTGRYGADMAGGVGVGGRGVIGYDRGDATRSWGGPVHVVPSPTAAYAAVGTPAGIYAPNGTVQDTLSNDPALTTYRQLLYARMIGGH